MDYPESISMSESPPQRTAEERKASNPSGKQDAHLRIVSSEEAVVFPEDAESSDDSPTVISKMPPLAAPAPVQAQAHPGLELSIKPESLVASLRGRRLAHYELIEPIGVGGMAAVIRARDTQLDRFVALKILPPEMAQEIENVHRFHQEAKAAAKLDHENIARVFFCGEDQGLHFIAFEFVQGINLRALLEKRGSLPVAEAIRYVLQVATGLEHAATRGVVHRDVKPSNIIITPNGRAKLVDMGLARNLERQGERDLTQSGVTLGTFDYISPEQALEPREADSRSDVYSLGCTLYHMLTGHAPVPEGTPAKKLHHHQHIAPLDPRQTHPEIPPEVIMVLGKMMAKNPRDRYQRPIHLVHHLMQVAQKVGAADDAPEGVLFVDAPLPDQPRRRPFLLMGLALTALVVVILLLSLISDSPVPPVEPASRKNLLTSVNPILHSEGGNTPTNTNLEPIPELSSTVKNVKDLQAVLADRSTREIKASIDGKIVLENGLVYVGNREQTLEFESEDPNGHATVSFSYRDGASAGLVVDGGKEVIFRRIKFQIDSSKTPTRAVAAVLVRGAHKVVFERCLFVQTEVPTISPGRVPLASLLIDAGKTGESSRPLVILKECFFDSNNQTGGQVAIAMNGAVNLNATNCAFKPHGAFFHFRPECRMPQTAVQLQNCSGFVVHGPAFRFDAEASARVSVDQSVFSRPDNSLVPQEGLPQSDLIFLADHTPMQYLGKSNLYHNLNALIEQKKGVVLIGPEEFQNYLAQSDGSDENSLYLNKDEPSVSPLQHAQPLDRSDDLAFQLKAEFSKNYGLQQSWSRKMPEPPGAPVVVKVTPAPVISKTKIVDAEDGGKTPGVLSNINQALVGAQDGDTILIKHGDNSREVSVQPIALKPGISVTLRPHEGHQPILVLDKDFRDKDICFFNVRKGSLRLEQLEIMLDPGLSNFEAQSIVQLGESAQCAFRQCVLTLRNVGKVQLNVATFLDTDRMMKMDSPPAGLARVEFDRCFIRGRGDLVNLRGCRLLQVDVRQSLIALAGSLLDIQSTNKQMAMDQGVHWNMDRSSIFTSEPVFALRCPNGKGLTKTIAERIEGCLLVALAPDQPVVLLEMAKDDDLKSYLDWKGERNFYAKFEKLRDWKEQYPDTSARSVYDRLTYPKLDEDAVQNLWEATPEWFRPIETDLDRVSGFGVPSEIESRLMPGSAKVNNP